MKNSISKNIFIKIKSSLNLEFTEKTSIEENLPSETKQQLFLQKYEEDYKNQYEISDKHSYLILTDKNVSDNIGKAMSWLIKKIGKTLFNGQSVMNISLPVFIFQARTMLQIFAYEFRLAPYYFKKAFYSQDKYEKLKYLTTFLITQSYFSTSISKPFSPRLGETYQTKIGDLNMYLEQTSSKPLTANFYCFDDDRCYVYSGNITTSASTGPNSCKAVKTGKSMLQFKTGEVYYFYFPDINIKGTTMGKKEFNVKHYGLVEDVNNKFTSVVDYSKDSKGFFKGIFGKKKTDVQFPDSFKGGIYNSSDVKISKNDSKHEVNEKAYELIRLNGRWTVEVLFDDKIYWQMNDMPLLPMMQMKFMLPSDTSLREDLIAFMSGDLKLAQDKKELVEEKQRFDRKLREKYQKNKK